MKGRSVFCGIYVALFLGCTDTNTAPSTPGNFNFYPGYYVLSAAHRSDQRQELLDDPLVAPFDGVQFRYSWVDSEQTPGDFSAGFAALDTDLAAVAAKGKKILVMLMYKDFSDISAVPADLDQGPGAWCSGSYCGDLFVEGTSSALLWNPVVEARLKAWITAMVSHIAASPHLSSVAGIVFNETALGTKDTTILAAAEYDANAYIAALQDNMVAAIEAAPTLITFLYFEGGFVAMDGSTVDYVGEMFGDWMLEHPGTGVGMPDLKPKDPKGPNHPCANDKYQGRIPCAPAIENGDYALAVTDSLDQSYNYAMKPAPAGLHASFLTFSYNVGPGPNAFSFSDVSAYVRTHPITNTDAPSW